MENYNIQIHDIEKGWEETPSKTLAFEERKQAVDFCYNLSYVLEGKEIRLSKGEIVGSQGVYIKM